MSATLPKRLPGQSLDAYVEVLVATLERQQDQQPSGAYDAAGPDNRTLDVPTATVGQVAEVLGTLVRDLQARGVIG